MILSSRLKGIFFASITAILWGFLAIALKVSLISLSPVDIAWFRFSVAFILLTAYYFTFHSSQFNIIKNPPILLIVAAICLGLNYLGFISGIKYTSPSVAQVFMQLGPVLLALSGFIIYKEKVTFIQLSGFIIVVCGLLLFYNEQLSLIATDKGIFNTGIIWVIFGALAWTGFAIIQKKLVRKYPPMQLNIVIFGIPALLYSPFVSYHSLREISLGYWILLIFLGLNTLAAYGSLAIALKHLEANKISVIITQNPVITFITMAILGGLSVPWISPENFTFLTVVGAIMVIGGAVLTVFTRNKNVHLFRRRSK
jgi:drug/metabolite transporter (DMT)-like permease